MYMTVTVNDFFWHAVLIPVKTKTSQIHTSGSMYGGMDGTTTTTIPYHT
jgi:hypothetical protein